MPLSPHWAVSRSTEALHPALPVSRHFYADTTRTDGWMRGPTFPITKLQRPQTCTAHCAGGKNAADFANLSQELILV